LSDLKIKTIDPTQIKYTPLENEIIRSPQGEYLIWKDDNWMKINMENSNINIDLYDMNKQIISQMPVLDNLEDKEYLVDNLHAKFENFYYMLYGKEISYFTLFKINESKYFGKEVIECLKDVGYIKAIDLTDTGDAIECWIENEQGPTCLYLFPYDAGVVQVGE
jgi:hypothetical protein